MPAKRKKERVVGTNFVWLLGQRQGVYYADGRSNKVSAGRHSLATRDYQAALEALMQLDQVQAVAVGLVDRASAVAASTLTLQEGRRLYMAHVERPSVVHGARPTTAKRYRAVFDKFEKFAQIEGLTCWNQVTSRVLIAYAAYLDDHSYADATEYLELTTLKQTVKWLAQEGHLPGSCVIHLPLDKPQGTTTYCWRKEEVQAMVRHCRAQDELTWLADVLTALACTGLRISELASRRWSDFDLSTNTIHIADESRRRNKRNPGQTRTTKSGRDRFFPINDDFRQVLDRLPQHADGFVFHGPRRGRLKPDSVRTSLIRDVLAPLTKCYPQAHGTVGFADGRLHSFRHFFCSECANSNVPEQMVMAWLGHSESKMVKYYYHLHDDEAQRQMKKLRFFVDAGSTGAASPVP